LSAAANRAAVARVGVRVDELQPIVIGNVAQAGNKMKRLASPVSSLVTGAALRANPVCGSGVQAIVSAAQE